MNFLQHSSKCHLQALFRQEHFILGVNFSALDCGSGETLLTAHFILAITNTMRGAAARRRGGDAHLPLGLRPMESGCKAVYHSAARAAKSDSRLPTSRSHTVGTSLVHAFLTSRQSGGSGRAAAPPRWLSAGRSLLCRESLSSLRYSTFCCSPDPSTLPREIPSSSRFLWGAGGGVSARRIGITVMGNENRLSI